MYVRPKNIDLKNIKVKPGQVIDVSEPFCTVQVYREMESIKVYRNGLYRDET
jgi:vacuolar-type H+-ATPase subunit B/Vma2